MWFYARLDSRIIAIKISKNGIFRVFDFRHPWNHFWTNNGIRHSGPFDYWSPYVCVP